MTDYKTLVVKYMGERKQWKAPVFGEIWQWNKFWLMGCSACGQSATLRDSKGGHTVTIKDGKATVTPSVGCPFCDAHYFVRDGKVVPA